MSALIKKIIAGWNEFWFQPEPPQALAVCRILFYAALLVAFGGIDFTPLCQVALVYWEPTSFYHYFFRHGPIPEGATAWLQVVWKISVVTSLLGLMTRTSTLIAGVLGVYLIGLTYNFGKLDHDMAVVALILIMFPLTHCGRIWSLDQFLAQRRGRPLPLLTGAEARWPIQMGRVLITLLMFSAGFNKVTTSGLPWITTDTLQGFLLQKNDPVGIYLAQWPFLCHCLAAFAIVTEFGYPLALVSKRLACIWVPAGLAMFAGIFLMMNVAFFFLMFIHFFWLPWGRLFNRKPTSVSDFFGNLIWGCARPVTG